MLKRLIYILTMVFFLITILGCTNMPTQKEVEGIKVDGKINSDGTEQGEIEFIIKNETEKTFTGVVKVKGDFDKSGLSSYEYEIDKLMPGNTTKAYIRTATILDPKYQAKAYGKFEEYKEEKSKVDYDTLYVLEKRNMHFIQTDVVNLETATEIVKNLKTKYGKTLGSVEIFDRNQKVKKGEKPNLGKIDPKASFSPGNSSVTVWETNETSKVD
ncbi:hypothetical protein [Paenibacillus larvae]|uniref:Lipoprotein n=1 Tax=Paenibacillus larvae subsp. larvae TaxID=147375 RepID=A0A2L1U468_9BACL|nr:hypothetical protein [Paenibacillus larvae]AQZ46035.1 hypothetical protein B5S25_04850 [Paenibacillus larvae subsp. pulvifaciens]AVF27678.1 hypothetical protein ERICIII_03568 [Paenibacillus larvae subsp. larvae]MBH0343685.1 hypothetical protein [Paenibacillus larvae]MCY7522147.1 hypothetical protein [Paenibacillus larvae]MCY9503285.1 hypothetical protein [Paenibacillus larvae]